MLIALANPEGDFTITFFAPKTTFEALQTADDIKAFFDDQFPDFAALVPDLVEQYQQNPVGRLGTLRATGWSHSDRAVIVGDAAHAIVPFHGQGMNAALESVRALDRHLREQPDDVAGAFMAYEAERKPDGDAIAEMALNNYVEMRAGVIDPDYLAKRELALELEQRPLQHGDVLDDAVLRGTTTGRRTSRPDRCCARRSVARHRRSCRRAATTTPT